MPLSSAQLQANNECLLVRLVIINIKVPFALAFLYQMSKITRQWTRVYSEIRLQSNLTSWKSFKYFLPGVQILVFLNLRDIILNIALFWTILKEKKTSLHLRLWWHHVEKLAEWTYWSTLSLKRPSDSSTELTKFFKVHISIPFKVQSASKSSVTILCCPIQLPGFDGTVLIN